MARPEWRVRYSDATTYDNLVGSWEEGRPSGIVCVVTLDPSGVWGRFVLHRTEYYYKIPGREVMAGDVKSLIRIHVPGILDSQIKRGGNAWREDFDSILHAAAHDPDFPTGSPRRRSTDWKGDGREPRFGV